MRPDLRHRFLVAMGISATIACSKDKGGETPNTVPSTSATTAATAPSQEPATSASAPPSASVATTTTTPQASGSAPVALPRPPFHGGCGFTVVCRPETASPKSPAAKPYQRCAANVPEDMNAPDGAHGEGTFDEETTKARRTGAPTTCCYKAPRRLCGGGRPLLAEGGPIVAPLVAREDWLDPAHAATTPSAELSAEWLRDAAMEHASVASFARASLQLLALGAPPSLVAGVHRAALDEIAHAETCFTLAARRGVTRGPGRLAVDRAPFATDVASFVRATYLEGCAGETEAAIDVRARAGRGDDEERAALLRIADDEERHAELAWQMLAWAVTTFGEPARAALQEAMTGVEGTPVVESLVLPCARALLDRSDWGYDPQRDQRHITAA